MFDEDHEAFQESFREFLDRKVLPGREQWRDSAAMPATVFLSAADSGFLGMQIPEEHNGGGADDVRFGLLAVQELAGSGLIGPALAFATHTNVAIPVLAHWAGAAQRAMWLSGLASGTTLASVIGTPSPLRFEEVCGGLRLDGVAKGVANGTSAGLLVVAARSDSGEYAVVVVDATAAGVSRKAGPELLGVHGADLADIHLDGVMVSTACVLPGDATEQFRTLCADEQLSLAAIGVAGARAALVWTLDYVRERKVFGRSVADFENTRFALAEVYADIALAETYLRSCAKERVAGQLAPSQAAAAKLRCTELFGRAVDQGMQLHGGYGYMREYPIAQAYADARYLRWHGGTSEEMKEILAAGVGL
ncbi:acyl-CoA dehydrogenase family protein [Streptomyces arenae]|uniref:acyl-CoA dehydrogenase family protein n=1 Tax=Streptomyces arenae TaxID=29301 RepID=UPI00265B67A8|nr:acyl-CoA dehydrogenase family protein [Streptomyces arenae]MCG7207415.1 acyl-CoA dehydrogenase family protein [Streptomyces arenae]